MGAGHTDGQARPSQLEVGAGVLGGLRVRWDPAPGPLTVGHVRPAGVFFSSGPRWRAARQLTVRALHGLGVGRAPVANKVLQELRCLTAQLDSYEGEWGPAFSIGSCWPLADWASEWLNSSLTHSSGSCRPVQPLEPHLHAETSNYGFRFKSAFIIALGPHRSPTLGRPTSSQSRKYCLPNGGWFFHPFSDRRG